MTKREIEGMCTDAMKLQEAYPWVGLENTVAAWVLKLSAELKPVGEKPVPDLQQLSETANALKLARLADNEGGTIGRSYDLLIAFAHHLYEDRNFDAEELLAVLEKPWKWQGEYDQWRREVMARAGEPE